MFIVCKLTKQCTFFSWLSSWKLIIQIVSSLIWRNKNIRAVELLLVPLYCAILLLTDRTVSNFARITIIFGDDNSKLGENNKKTHFFDKSIYS